MAAPLSRREIRAMERKFCFTPFEFSFDLGILVSQGISDRFMKAGMAKMVERVGPRGSQSTLHLMQSLGSGFEVRPLVADAEFYWGVVAQLKMQGFIGR